MTLWTIDRCDAPGWNYAIRDDAGTPVAFCGEHNVFRHSIPDIEEDPRPRAVAVRTGWLSDHADDAPSIATWTPRGWAAWAQKLPEIECDATGLGLEPWIWPHARHVVSDVQSTRNLIRGLPETSPTRLLLDPRALLTGSMLNAATDHLWRAVDSLADESRTAAVILTGILPGEPSDEDGPSGPMALACPIGRGVVEVTELRKMAEAVMAAGKPVVLLAGEAASQREAIGLA